MARLFLSPLRAHHFAAGGLENILGDAWVATRSPVVLVARWISLVAFPAVWVGMLLALPRVWRVLRLSPRAGPIDHIFAVAWAAVVFQAALDGFQHVYEGPHYLNAAWIVYAAFLFLLARHAPAWIIGAYGASLLTVTIAIAVSIHQNAGMRSANYGSALWAQIEAVEEIQEFSGDSPLKIDIPQWTAHPIALTTLGELHPPSPAEHPAAGFSCITATRPRWTHTSRSPCIDLGAACVTFWAAPNAIYLSCFGLFFQGLS